MQPPLPHSCVSLSPVGLRKQFPNICSFLQVLNRKYTKCQDFFHKGTLPITIYSETCPEWPHRSYMPRGIRTSPFGLMCVFWSFEVLGSSWLYPSFCSYPSFGTRSASQGSSSTDSLRSSCKGRGAMKSGRFSLGRWKEPGENHVPSTIVLNQLPHAVLDIVLWGVWHGELLGQVCRRAPVSITIDYLLRERV